MTNTFKPAGAALAAVVAGIAAPTTMMASEAPDLGATETPMAQAEAFAKGLAALVGVDADAGAPNSALLDVPLAGLADHQQNGFG
jgi:hypothetical protein